VLGAVAGKPLEGSAEPHDCHGRILCERTGQG
jgi:hypothetical protein